MRPTTFPIFASSLKTGTIAMTDMPRYMFSAPQSIAAADQPMRDDDARMKCNPVRMYAPVQVCWLKPNECERRSRDRLGAPASRKML